MEYLYAETQLGAPASRIVLTADRIITSYHSTVRVYDQDFVLLSEKYFYERICDIRESGNNLVVLFAEAKLVQLRAPFERFEPFCFRTVPGDFLCSRGSLVVAYDRLQFTYFHTTEEELTTVPFRQLGMHGIEHCVLLDTDIPTLAVVWRRSASTLCSLVSLLNRAVIEEFAVVDGLLAMASGPQALAFLSAHFILIRSRRECFWISLHPGILGTPNKTPDLVYNDISESGRGEVAKTERDVRASQAISSSERYDAASPAETDRTNLVANKNFDSSTFLEPFSSVCLDNPHCFFVAQNVLLVVNGDGAVYAIEYPTAVSTRLSMQRIKTSLRFFPACLFFADGRLAIGSVSDHSSLYRVTVHCEEEEECPRFISCDIRQVSICALPSYKIVDVSSGLHGDAVFCTPRSLLRLEAFAHYPAIRVVERVQLGFRAENIEVNEDTLVVQGAERSECRLRSKMTEIKSTTVCPGIFSASGNNSENYITFSKKRNEKNDVALLGQVKDCVTERNDRSIGEENEESVKRRRKNEESEANSDGIIGITCDAPERELKEYFDSPEAQKDRGQDYISHMKGSRTSSEEQEHIATAVHKASKEQRTLDSSQQEQRQYEKELNSTHENTATIGSSIEACIDRSSEDCGGKDRRAVRRERKKEHGRNDFHYVYSDITVRYDGNTIRIVSSKEGTELFSLDQVSAISASGSILAISSRGTLRILEMQQSLRCLFFSSLFSTFPNYIQNEPLIAADSLEEEEEEREGHDAVELQERSEPVELLIKTVPLSASVLLSPATTLIVRTLEQLYVYRLSGNSLIKQFIPRRLVFPAVRHALWDLGSCVYVKARVPYLAFFVHGVHLVPAGVSMHSPVVDGPELFFLHRSQLVRAYLPALFHTPVPEKSESDNDGKQHDSSVLAVPGNESTNTSKHLSAKQTKQACRNKRLSNDSTFTTKGSSDGADPEIRNRLQDRETVTGLHPGSSGGAWRAACLSHFGALSQSTLQTKDNLAAPLPEILPQKPAVHSVPPRLPMEARRVVFLPGCVAVAYAAPASFFYVPFVPMVHIACGPEGRPVSEPVYKDFRVNNRPALLGRTLFHKICLFSPNLEFISDVSLKEHEFVCDMKFLFGDFFVVCTSFCEGEDKFAKGRILVYVVVDIVPEKDAPYACKRLRLVAEEQMRSPCVACEGVCGLLAVCTGTRLMIYSLDVNNGITPVGRTEVSTLSTHIIAVKNYLLVADVYRGAFFFFLRPKDPIHIHLIARTAPVDGLWSVAAAVGFLEQKGESEKPVSSRHSKANGHSSTKTRARSSAALDGTQQEGSDTKEHRRDSPLSTHRYHSNPLVNRDKELVQSYVATLNLMTLDSSGNISIFTYSPRYPPSNGGRILIKRCEIRTQVATSSMTRSTQLGPSTALFVSENILMAVRPFESSKARMFAECIAYCIEDSCGINPRNYLEPTKHLNLECGSCVAEHILLEFFHMGPRAQARVLRMAGMSRLEAMKIYDEVDSRRC